MLTLARTVVYSLLEHWRNLRDKEDTMTTHRDHITIFEARLNIGKIADALCVSEEVALAEMRDARVASRWAEHWGAQVEAMVKSVNTNEPGHDISGQAGSSNILVSNKCLTKNGVRFQDSRFIGSGRHCTVEDVKSSLDAVELVQVVDISQIPLVLITMVHSRYLRAEIHAGRLGCNGWKASAFYGFVERTYDHNIQHITLAGVPVA
jgi:hypothetical protein